MAKFNLDYMDHQSKDQQEPDWYMDCWNEGDPQLTVEVVLNRPGHYHLYFKKGSTWAESTSITAVDNLGVRKSLLVGTRSGAKYFLSADEGEDLSALRAEIRSFL